MLPERLARPLILASGFLFGILVLAEADLAQADDRENAMSLLDESLAISSELGMRPLMERVLYRREILKA